MMSIFTNKVWKIQLNGGNQRCFILITLKCFVFSHVKKNLISLNCEIKSHLEWNEFFILEMTKGQFPTFKIQFKLKNLLSTAPFMQNASFLIY